MAHALAHHLHDAAARLLDGVACIKLDRTVVAHYLPIGAAEYLAAHLWAFEMATGDENHAPLAERRRPHRDDVADLGGELEQELERRRLHCRLPRFRLGAPFARWAAWGTRVESLNLRVNLSSRSRNC